jgi:Baseplate J-like protein
MSTPRPDPPRLDPIPPGTESCLCCDGVAAATPLAIENRGGLSAISYRIGGYADFRESLHAALSSSDFRKLGELRTRDEDDFTIGLIDAFACVADVLTFYQERIANESYLGTALERVSLAEMGRLIGYRLRPGVAAETLLAFTFETPPTPPPSAKPEPGMFVTGVPEQVTVAAGLAVRSVPAPDETPQVFETVEAFTARPTWNALQPWMREVGRPVRGATSTFLGGVATGLRPGDALLIVGDEFLANRDSNQWDFRIIDSVTIDPANDRTRVSWRRPLGSIDPPMNPSASPQVFALRRRAAVFGHNAPVWLTMTTDFRSGYELTFPRGETPVPILLRAAIRQAEDWPRFEISRNDSSIDLDSLYSEMPSGSFVVLTRGDFNYPAEPGPPDTYVELYSVNSVAEVSREEFGVTAKVTRLGLAGANYDKFRGDVRGTSVFGQSEALPLAEYPVNDAVAGDSIPVVVAPEGLDAGRHLLIRGNRASDGVAIIHGATLVSAVAVGAGRSILTIDPPLPAPLRRESVVVHANVALATHGETVSQILGAGNAATPFQRFELKQLPLTYRAAANELGASPQLTVRVDDIAWKTCDSLFGTQPRDRVFTLQSDEQGRNFVTFGDGLRGARPSSGVNNVRATYRKGLGAAGNVAAESLTQPTQRPLGMKGVSNPLPAEGGTDPESAELARQAMPLMTRTLGRAVSLLDYEDFARAFSGIAKARAQVLHLPSGPTIAITIAGSAGVVISPDSPIWINLAAALADNGDPHVAVRLLAHHPGTFRIGLRVKCDPDFDSSLVLREVEASLRAAFGFDARALAQPVQQSEVIAAAQRVRGVIAVDLDLLYGGTQPQSQTQRSLQVRLLANRMSVSDGVLIPDEVLTLHPAPFERLEVMP